MEKSFSKHLKRKPKDRLSNYVYWHLTKPSMSKF